jgi:cytochrome c biogenesis protein CcdA/thiol-disulfide isomerase/thioredoxin
MALTFAGVSTLAVIGGGWVVQANLWGRWIAMAILALFAFTLLSPTFAEWINRPFLRLGGALQGTAPMKRSPGASFVLGIATGFLWAPCAGPILGLILTGAALRGASVSTTVLLLAYALGAATSLALALAAGGKFLKTLKGYLKADIWVRRVLGIAVLLGVAAALFGWDRGLLTRLSRVQTEGVEQKLIQTFHADVSPSTSIPDRHLLNALTGATAWINSKPLTADSLKGKVVLIDFWTYSCINCLRTLPYLKAWAEKYHDAGLVIIGVHTPEFAFEKDPANVRKAIHDLGLTYPVALDNDYAIWNAFSNRYWPAHYFFDATGALRDQHFGEGDYAESEATIQSLLKENKGARSVPTGLVDVTGKGALAPGGAAGVRSPETYIGYGRSENQVALPELIRDRPAHYVSPAQWGRNQWSLEGEWNVGSEKATLIRAPGRIVFRFLARDLHLVLGPGQPKKPIRFHVLLDGQAPGDAHGTDVTAQGEGVVNDQRLYQLIRQADSDPLHDHLFEIRFLDAGVEAFAFTFG